MSRLPDLLRLHAARQPDRPALVDDRPDGTFRTWSFSELNADVNRLGRALQRLQVGRGDKLVWCGRNSPGVVRMVHAARKIGATAVPLNYRLAPEEAAYVVDNSDAVLVYADAQTAELFDSIRGELSKVRTFVVFDGEPGSGWLGAEKLMAEESDQEPVVGDSDEPAATMIYTSGTTGKPKGALRIGQGDPDQARRMVAAIGYQPDDIYLTTGPLYHSGPGGFMVIAHTLGHTVVVQRKFDPADWLRLVDRHRVTSTFSAPTPIRMVCNLSREVKERYDCSSLRIMIANAAPWSFALKEAYLRDFPPHSLFEIYGSTELGVNTILRPEDQLRKRGSCGRPAPGVDLALFDDEGREIREPNVPGELFVQSKSVFATYYKARQKYEADRRGSFHTVGDVAYFDREGYFYICDRKKDMIISGGMNIYPAEIEAALDRHPDILDVAVFGIPSEEWGESVHAVVVPRDGKVPAESEIVAFSRQHLAGYKVPRSISFMDSIPRTGSGKILKRVLREPYWKNHESGVV